MPTVLRQRASRAPTHLPLLWGVLVSRAPGSREGSPGPCGRLADPLSVFVLRERLCEDKGFETGAPPPIRVAGLTDLHGDHKSTSVPSHFPGRVSVLRVRCSGLEPSAGELLPCLPPHRARAGLGPLPARGTSGSAASVLPRRWTEQTDGQGAEKAARDPLAGNRAAARTTETMGTHRAPGSGGRRGSLCGARSRHPQP